MRLIAVATSSLAVLCSTALAFAPLSSSSSRRSVVTTPRSTALQVTRTTAADDDDDDVDVVVIGSGLAGLSCAALLSHCDRRVMVLESHDAPGGAAHTWSRRGFHFESGPSLYSGFSMDRSPNPLKQIFQIISTNF